MQFLTELASRKARMPDPEQALPGRDTPIATAETHFVNGRPLKGPYPAGLQMIHFGMGCFWGAERLFWQIRGVWVTAVGYAGGFTPNPTYQETCTGLTGHAEMVRLVYDPEQVTINELLAIFWENHDPTQGMRQGNDIGTTYRSAIYVESDQDLRKAEESKLAYQRALNAAGARPITTEIRLSPPFYFAEAEHQQYLAKVPNGYCGLVGTGVCFPDPQGAG